mmetsp:Transcript_36323/g.90636  ORF Transcript_36323/g.90636 Transcript_36323/m.90636 type:complete len:94 (-) Transcript_36323:240-521(-)
MFWNPFITLDVLEQPSVKGSALELNADLSHWCCVCERLFNPATEPRDAFWPETLAQVASRAAFIHCRVGWAQGPQVSDPAAPEFAKELRGHLD